MSRIFGSAVPRTACTPHRCCSQISFFLPPKPRKWQSPENVHGSELIPLQFTKGFVNMLLLIPAFRSLLSSGASLLSGAFFFGTRKVSWFSGLAALMLSATLPASANAASQLTITFDHYSLMVISHHAGFEPRSCSEPTPRFSGRFRGALGAKLWSTRFVVR
jgi:hypothetical protein